MKNWNDWNNWNDVPDDVDDATTTPDATPGVPFPDPWDGDHDIEYWVWSGERLVPATPSQQAEIQETERIASARRRLRRWHSENGQQHMTVRIRIFRGIRQAIAGTWQMARHVIRPVASTPEARHAAVSARHQRDER